MKGEAKKEAKKKGTPQKLFAMLVQFLSGMGCGLIGVMHIDRVMGDEFDIGRALMLFGLVIISVYAAQFIHIVLHEAGHLVFGLATGYRFISFRMLNFMWVRDGGRLRLGRFSIPGTGGQCLMAPPELADGNMPVMLYNFGGVIMNAVAGGAALGLSFVAPESSFLTAFLRIMAVSGAAAAIMNGVPLRGQLSNDGSNALELKRSADARRAFWIQGRVTEHLAEGVRLKDMPDEWFAVPESGAMGESLTAAAGVLACERLMDAHRFDEADALMERMLSGGGALAEIHRAMLTCDRIYIELIGPNRPDVRAALLTDGQKRLMRAMRGFITVQRTEFAWALLADRDGAAALDVKARFERTAASYPYPVETDGERELMDIARGRYDGDLIDGLR